MSRREVQPERGRGREILSSCEQEVRWVGRERRARGWRWEQKEVRHRESERMGGQADAIWNNNAHQRGIEIDILRDTSRECERDSERLSEKLKD